MQSILIIDDDMEVSSILSEGLRGAGYHVVTAHSAPEALAKLSRQRFNVVVADLHIGQGNGEDVIRQMRARGHENEMTPVVVISGFVDQPVVMRLRAQVQGVLVKPFLPKALVDKVKLAREMGVMSSFVSAPAEARRAA